MIPSLSNQLKRAEFFRSNPKYRGIVERAHTLYKQGNLDECKKSISFLPTDEKLFEALAKKLEGKSVSTGIRRLSENKTKTRFENAKIYSSLLTHVLVECEHGNLEYRALVEPTMNKILESLA